MNIDIYSNDVELNSQARDWVKTKVASSFHRLQHLIRSIEIKVSDQNGPKGGKDIGCVLLLKGDSFDVITITDIESDFKLALSRALSRARRTLIRRIKREISN